MAKRRGFKKRAPRVIEGLHCSTIELVNKKYVRAVVRNTVGHRNSCAPVALAIIMNKPYAEINEALKLHGLRVNDNSGTYTWKLYDKGWGFERVPYGHGMTIAAFARLDLPGEFLIFVRGHVVAFVDGVLYNTIEKGRRQVIQRVWKKVN